MRITTFYKIVYISTAISGVICGFLGNRTLAIVLLGVAINSMLVLFLAEKVEDIIIHLNKSK